MKDTPTTPVAKYSSFSIQPHGDRPGTRGRVRLSAMTVHRDLERLAGAGILQSTRKRTLPSQATHDSSPASVRHVQPTRPCPTSVIIQAPVAVV